uniref:Uncharacterized protein n=1 Tax=Octopus bimaculoides TaxID=37653 RepID=A0A0L8I8Y8_OCTBM
MNLCVWQYTSIITQILLLMGICATHTHTRTHTHTHTHTYHHHDHHHHHHHHTSLSTTSVICSSLTLRHVCKLI